ncbi:hypothetical protein STAS_10188 [Striga asiatica]|uniref:Uncharacterized protein n=1 Tax=Striga asiatica TaxID=4170 RepID=A0A5A7PML5_STRAF|nr:hypothetical protein STAS_10188 [Striga asiatica]
MSNLRFDFDFDSLRDLHESVNKSLHSPHAKLEILANRRERFAHDLSESSLKMADSCAAAKDLLLVAKTHLQDLESAFRRAADGEQRLSSHRLPRKQLKKAILKRLDSLKGAGVADPPPEEGGSLAAVVEVLAEIRSAMVGVVRSLMSLIALPEKGGSGRKDPIFRLRLRRVDSLRLWEKCDPAEVRKRLEEVEAVVEEMEEELDRMFRRLIRTRASLLNILTT